MKRLCDDSITNENIFFKYTYFINCRKYLFFVFAVQNALLSVVASYFICNQYSSKQQQSKK